jgi:hypothetical protein
MEQLRTRFILKSKASVFNTEFSQVQYLAAEQAMIEFAQSMVDKYRYAESKAISIEAVKLFPALWKGQFKLWLRKRAFIMAKKEAQIKANMEGRPVHVVRSSEIAFIVQTTKEVRNLKKRGIYKKNVDAIKMNGSADYTAYPQRSNINQK